MPMTPTKPLQTLIIVLSLVALAGGMTACGTDEEAEKRRAAQEQAAREKAAKERKERQEAAKAARLAEACEESVGPLLDELEELNSRLDIGLTYDEYTDRVGDVKVAYDKADFGDAGEDDLRCITEVGLPAEKAFNQYAKAAATWQECFDDIDCDNDSIQPDLQRRWSRATTLTERARDNLNDMKKPA